jgi:hypothetical protein
MRKITTTLADLDKLVNQFGLTMPELVNLYSKPLPPIKHDAHVGCQLVGEWMMGCNSHVELWQETLDN